MIRKLKDILWELYFWVKYPKFTMRRYRMRSRKYQYKYHKECVLWYLAYAKGQRKNNNSREWAQSFEQVKRHHHQLTQLIKEMKNHGETKTDIC